MNRLKIIKIVLVVLILSAIAALSVNSQTESVEVSKEEVQIEEKPEFSIKQKVFGYSVKNRAIEGYEIGSGENTIMLFGAIHGNEKGTADLLNKLIEEVKNNPSLVSLTKKLVVIPIINPDGYLEEHDKYNANDVNLNLNFETSGWSQYGKAGTFGGLKPFTEPESQVIKQVVEEYKPSMMIAFHAQGALVSPELNQSSIDLGQWYADKTGYQYNDQWDDSGTATKWFAETTGKSAITVELSEYFKSDWEINKAALLELIA